MRLRGSASSEHSGREVSQGDCLASGAFSTLTLGSGTLTEERLLQFCSSQAAVLRVLQGEFGPRPILQRFPECQTSRDTDVASDVCSIGTKVLSDPSEAQLVAVAAQEGSGTSILGLPEGSAGFRAVNSKQGKESSKAQREKSRPCMGSDSVWGARGWSMRLPRVWDGETRQVEMAGASSTSGKGTF